LDVRQKGVLSSLFVAYVEYLEGRMDWRRRDDVWWGKWLLSQKLATKK